MTANPDPIENQTRLAQADAEVKRLEQALLEQTTRAKRAEARVVELEQELRVLKRALFGEKSERGKAKPRADSASEAEQAKAKSSQKPMPSRSRQTQKSANDDSSEEERRAKTREKRRAARERRKALPVVSAVADVPADKKKCGGCDDDFRPLGEGEISHTTEWIPGHFVRRRHVRRRYVCRCGSTIVVAENSERVAEKVTYGPGFHAYTAISKCLDSMPLHRLAKSMRRQGVDINASTLGDIFHRVAKAIEPVYNLIMLDIAKHQHLNADETTIQMLGPNKTKRCYMWVFVGQSSVAYLFSVSRSGSVPQSFLKETSGTLQVDGYTGYNKVTTPDSRTRAGCWAHVRRYFFNASETTPIEAEEMSVPEKAKQLMRGGPSKSAAEGWF